MKGRCTNPADPQFQHYGGRGITVCDRWARSFTDFCADVGERPPGVELDRINNDAGYEPSNVRWATSSEQKNNRRNNVRITAHGKTQTLKEWSHELGIGYTTLRQRHLNGWDAERLLSTPVDTRYSHSRLAMASADSL
jgi:hypothetical protein